MIAFKRIDPLAGWLLLPYLLWVGFAAYLTTGIWWLNRAAAG
jgi:tryptophan-rich sensory protein